MNNTVCKKCGAVICDNEFAELDGVTYCNNEICANSNANANGAPVITSDSMSWSDIMGKHDWYE